MEISSKPGKELLYKIGRVAAAIAFTVVIGGFAVGTARADDHRGHDAHGGDRHAENHDRDDRGHDVYYSQQPDYYAPPVNYYNTPEPYYYDGDQPQPSGINLFFGL